MESPSSPKPIQSIVTTLSFVAGAGQVARKGTVVPVAPVAVVKDQNGTPMPGVTVNFTTGPKGSIAISSAVTAADGTASAGSWTLSTSTGENEVIATAVGGSNPHSNLIAASRNPLWTLVVYMAADNNLASSGIDNIDQIEAAGLNPEVQVVIQAEFSASELNSYGCNSFCFNRPNFDTFRYVVSSGANVRGPNGPVIDIGNRNMTDPAQLNEFINFAKQAAPAEHYVVFLWNHGNGYRGVFEDDFSAPGNMMTLNQLAAAFGGVGQIDIVAFDMCLMGGYETLSKLNGIASYAVFSENTVPGSGYPYQTIMAALQTDPRMTSKNVATMFADNFDAYYAGQRPSTTISAYDLSGFSSFEAVLGNLANSLRSNLGPLSGAIAASAAGSQSFEITSLKDLGSFLDSLGTHTNDGPIAANIEAVRRAAGAFRIQQHARTGSDYRSINVGRATGLSIMMPSGVGSDRLPASGFGSLAAYEAIVGSRPWGQLIAEWMANKSPLGYTDTGSNRYETYLVWDSAAVRQGADVDLFVLEPNGMLFSPAFGTISPNGLFTADSYSTRIPVEGYQMGRYVETGVYRFYAALWTDTNKYGPVYNVVYRNSPSASFQGLYTSPYPRLTTATSILRDPNPTFGKIDTFQYTDFRPVAILTIPPNASGDLVVEMHAESSVTPRMSLSAGPSAAAKSDGPTSPQIATVRRLMSERRAHQVPGKSLPLPTVQLPVPIAERH